MHRNPASSRETCRLTPFAQFQGKDHGFTKGRDRSFHFGSRDRIVGMISHLGPQLGLADGVAPAEKLEGTGGCSFVFTGDGGASRAIFTKPNVAAVWQLLVIIGIENNAWGLSTPASSSSVVPTSRTRRLATAFPRRTPSRWMETTCLMYHKVRESVESLREEPRPIILEFKTFRIRGHEEASGTKYYPEGLIDTWAQVDPVDRIREHLMAEGVLDQAAEDAMREQIKGQIEAGLKGAAAEPLIEADTVEDLDDRFAPGTPQGLKEIPTCSGRELRFIDAIT